MKFSFMHHVNTVKDRMRSLGFERLTRFVSMAVAMVLIAIPAFVPMTLLLIAGYEGFSMGADSAAKTPYSNAAMRNPHRVILTEDMLAHSEKDAAVLYDPDSSPSSGSRISSISSSTSSG